MRNSYDEYMKLQEEAKESNDDFFCQRKCIDIFIQRIEAANSNFETLQKSYKEILKTLGITSSSLADKTKIPNSTLSTMFSSDKTVHKHDYDIMKKIFDALNDLSEDKNLLIKTIKEKQIIPEIGLYKNSDDKNYRVETRADGVSIIARNIRCFRLLLNLEMQNTKQSPKEKYIHEILEVSQKSYPQYETNGKLPEEYVIKLLKYIKENIEKIDPIIMYILALLMADNVKDYEDKLNEILFVYGLLLMNKLPEGQPVNNKKNIYVTEYTIDLIKLQITVLYNQVLTGNK